MDFKIKSIAAIRILTDDLEKSRDFYRALFKLDPIEESEVFVSFKVGESRFDITIADAKNPISQGGSVSYWLIDNLALALQRAKELGGKLYRGPLDVPEIQRTIAQIQDPCGGIIGFEAPYECVSTTRQGF